MPLPMSLTIGILADNLRLRGSVMPIGTARLTRWAKGLNLPKGGGTVIFTGHMYQLMPSITAMQARMQKMEGSPLARFMGLGRFVNRFFNTARLMSRPNRASQEAFDKRLRNIARLLQIAGVDFGYLYGDEYYAGALVCDLGVEHVFRKHAQRVYDALKANGVKRVITVDPHTTDMLRSEYPKVVPGFDIEVTSYIEVLVEKGIEAKKQLGTDAVLHDSCVYARYVGLVDEPRALLKGAGVKLEEQFDSKKLTHCCGGPVESLFPEKAKAIASRRLLQLEKSGSKNITTACPICLVNLQHAAVGNGATVRDLAEVLMGAYGED